MHAFSLPVYFYFCLSFSFPQAGLKLDILLPQPFTCWHYKHVPPNPALCSWHLSQSSFHSLCLIHLPKSQGTSDSHPIIWVMDDALTVKMNRGSCLQKQGRQHCIQIHTGINVTNGDRGMRPDPSQAFQYRHPHPYRLPHCSCPKTHYVPRVVSNPWQSSVLSHPDAEVTGVNHHTLFVLSFKINLLGLPWGSGNSATLV